MIQHRVLRIAELCELMAKELRAAAIDMGWTPGPEESPLMATGEGGDESSAIPVSREASGGNPRSRAEDTMIRLEEYGYVTEGTGIRLISKLIPRGADPHDARFRAQIGRNPSKPVWLHNGEQMRSLTQLSKRLRDEHAIPFPRSSFNACKFWCIEREWPHERTLESIAKQMVL